LLALNGIIWNEEEDTLVVDGDFEAVATSIGTYLVAQLSKEGCLEYQGTAANSKAGGRGCFPLWYERDPKESALSNIPA